MTGREERGAHPADPAWAPLRQDDRSFRKGTLGAATGAATAATPFQPVAAPFPGVFQPLFQGWRRFAGRFITVPTEIDQFSSFVLMLGWAYSISFQEE
jgi:hypothetical protein